MKNKKIFIIEDDANILAGLQAKFRLEGVEIETSMGDEPDTKILTKIKNFSPDFIILDLILPKIDGFDFIKKIKENSETVKIPIFVFSNLSDKDSQSKASDLGSYYYFIKSEFSLDQFVAKVKGIIKNREKMKKN